MKVTDVRLGNYIASQDGTYAVHEVIGIQDKFITSQPPYTYDWVSNAMASGPEGQTSALPLALTEAWCIKLGFVGGKMMVRPFLEFSFCNGVFSMGIESGVTVLHHIKYVHQVQNLYFAITGQELSMI